MTWLLAVAGYVAIGFSVAVMDALVDDIKNDTEAERSAVVAITLWPAVLPILLIDHIGSLAVRLARWFRR